MGPLVLLVQASIRLNVPVQRVLLAGCAKLEVLKAVKESQGNGT